MLRNLLRYLMLLASFGVLSILYNEYHMSILFLTLAAMPVVMFLLLCYFYFTIKAELISVVPIAGKNQMIPVSISIQNPAIFPVTNLKIYLVYKNAYSSTSFRKEFMISLDGKAKTTFVFHIYSQYCGNIEINFKGLRVYDYVKLFSFRRKYNQELKVAVLPEFNELQDQAITRDQKRVIENDQYSIFKNGDDPTEVFAIREYREGDLPKRIHWKLSNKLDRLMMKEYSQPQNCFDLIFLNLTLLPEAPTLLYMDAFLESALVLSYTLLTNRKTHFISWYDAGRDACARYKIEQEKDFYEAIDSLLQVLPSKSGVGSLLHYRSEHPSDQYSNLFYFTAESDIESMEALTMLQAWNKYILYITKLDYEERVPNPSNAIVRQSEEMGIELWPVDLYNAGRILEQLQAVSL